MRSYPLFDVLPTIAMCNSMHRAFRCGERLGQFCQGSAGGKHGANAADVVISPSGVSVPFSGLKSTPMPPHRNAMAYVFVVRDILQIHEPVVVANGVDVVDLFTDWAWTDKGLHHKPMNPEMLLIVPISKPDAAVSTPADSTLLHHAMRCNLENPTEIGNQIPILVTDNRTPIFAIMDFRHASLLQGSCVEGGAVLQHRCRPSILLDSMLITNSRATYGASPASTPGGSWAIRPME